MIDGLIAELKSKRITKLDEKRAMKAQMNREIREIERAIHTKESELAVLDKSDSLEKATARLDRLQKEYSKFLAWDEFSMSATLEDTSRQRAYYEDELQSLKDRIAMFQACAV